MALLLPYTLFVMWAVEVFTIRNSKRTEKNSAYSFTDTCKCSQSLIIKSKRLPLCQNMFTVAFIGYKVKLSLLFLILRQRFRNMFRITWRRQVYVHQRRSKPSWRPVTSKFQATSDYQREKKKDLLCPAIRLVPLPYRIYLRVASVSSLLPHTAKPLVRTKSLICHLEKKSVMKEP